MTTIGLTGSGQLGHHSGRVAVELGHNVVNAGRGLPAVLMPHPEGATSAIFPLRSTDPDPATVEDKDA